MHGYCSQYVLFVAEVEASMGMMNQAHPFA